jgi:transcriptional regulator with XRE-family HTH domain
MPQMSQTRGQIGGSAAYRTRMLSVGKLLQRARRVNTRMTQEQAAKAAGFRSKTYLSQIEAGIKIPPPDTAARLARVVGLTPAQMRKAGFEEAADELAELLEIFGSYVEEDGDRAILTQIKALSEDQRRALFALLKVLPAAVPVALVSLLRRVPKRSGLVAAGGATVATVGVAAALAITLTPTSPGQHDGAPLGNQPPGPGVAVSPSGPSHRSKAPRRERVQPPTQPPSWPPTRPPTFLPALPTPLLPTRPLPPVAGGKPLPRPGTDDGGPGKPGGIGNGSANHGHADEGVPRPPVHVPPPVKPGPRPHKSCTLDIAVRPIVRLCVGQKTEA